MDDCGGHPNNDGEYHYHGWNNFTSPVHVNDDDTAVGLNAGCLSTKNGGDFDAGACPAPFIGVAMDGFPIYGPQKCDNCLTRDANTGKCDSWSTTATGLFTTSELTSGGRSVNSSNPIHDGDSDKKHVFEYRLHTDQYYHINCYRGTPAESNGRCTGNNASDAKKRADENLAQMEAAEEEERLEEVEEEQQESRLRYLLKALLDKRGKE
ncbi:uncharacterized protein [Amphiura filiformis]|uniref:uncharacterized protein n=1 Tax=Amphiura filiformis TaxID=82378 RepID=UPI003B21F6DD